MKLVITNKTKSEILSKDELESVALLTLKATGQAKSKVNIGLFLLEQDEMKELNFEHRCKNCPTDVLSFRWVQNPNNLKLTKKNFPLDYDSAEGAIYLGDIFICVDVADKQSKEYGHSTKREVAELFVHGLLHLLGFDHHEEEETKRMRAAEESINSKLDGKI